MKLLFVNKNLGRHTYLIFTSNDINMKNQSPYIRKLMSAL